MNNYEFWNDMDKIFEAVVAYQEKTIEFNKRFINPWVNLGYVFEKKDKKETKEAIAAHKNAIEIDPENAQNWYQLASAYSHSGDFDRAIQAYQKALDLGFESGDLYKNMGLAYAMTARHQESIPFFQNALELSENENEKAMIWNHLGNIHRKLNDYEMAFRAFQQADKLENVIPKMENQPTEDTVEEVREISTLKDDKHSASQSTVETVPAMESDSIIEENDTTSNPSDPSFEQDDNLKDEEYDTSYQSLTDNVEESLEEDNGDDFNDDMPVVLEIDFTKSGLDDFLENENLAEDNESPVSVETGLAESDIDKADSEPGPVKDHFSKSEYDSTTTFSAYEEYLQDNIKPIMKNRENDHSEDEQSFARMSDEVESTSAELNKEGVNTDLTFDMDTNNAHVWNELGNVYFNSGSFDDAIAAYRKAIELDRQFAWPYTNLAMVYVQNERFEEAILLYQRSIELFSDEKDKAVTWNRLGNLYRRLDDYEKAIAAYQRADDLDPGNNVVTNQTKFSLLGSEEIEQEVEYSL